MSGWARQRSRFALVAGFVAVGAVLAGCSGTSGSGAGALGGNPNTNPGPNPPTRIVSALPATLTSTVRAAATDVPVDTAVSVTAKNGTLQSVVLSDAAGTSLPGALNPAKTVWTAAGFLDPATHYTLAARAVNGNDVQTRSVRAFTTAALTLAQQTYPSVTPLQGAVMGIGMPVIVNFDVAVTDRAEFEKYMHVTSTPAQPGSWHWISSHEVHWRPRTYWQPGTKVHVDLALNGVYAGNGIYGQIDRHVNFTIGQGVLIKANVATDQMHVYVNGTLTRTIPITGGKPGGFQTRSGTKLISEKYLSKRMNSATVGIDPNGPNGYNIPDVQFAMRVTNSGEFLHAAPWSVYAQGHYNVSHGCVGMSTDNAHWLFDLAEIGTPVEVSGSSRPIEPNNGWTDWNMTWSQWRAGSALK